MDRLFSHVRTKSSIMYCFTKLTYTVGGIYFANANIHLLVTAGVRLNKSGQKFPSNFPHFPVISSRHKDRKLISRKNCISSFYNDLLHFLLWPKSFDELYLR